MSEKTYPLYEVNVIDKSIYRFTTDEVLPVHRAVWVLPTEKGPVGEPIWVKTKKQFDRIFGKQTLALYSSKYKSTASFWLYNLLQKNGQFIVRALPESAKRATAIVEARVIETENGMPKFLHEKEENGVLLRDIATVTASSTARFKGKKGGSDVDDPYNPNNIQDYSDFGKYAIEVDSVTAVDVVTVYRDKYGYVKHYSVTKSNGGDTTTTWYEIATDGSVTLRTDTSEPAHTNLTEETLYYHTVKPKTQKSLRIAFTVRPANDDELAYFMDPDSAPLPSTLKVVDESTAAKTLTDGSSMIVYPLFAIAANYEGGYGDDYAFRLFSAKNMNNAENVAWFRSVFNNFGAYHREFNTSTTDPIKSKYNKNYVTFASDPAAVDRETRVKKSMEAVIEKSYDSSNDDSDEFPFFIYSIEDNLRLIGERIIEVENFDAVNLGLESINEFTATDCEEFMNFVGGKPGDRDPSTGKCAWKSRAATHDWGKAGFMVDVIGGTSPSGRPYPHVQYANGQRYTTNEFVIVETENVKANLENGEYRVASPEADEFSSDWTETGGEDISLVALNQNENIYLMDGSDGLGDDSPWDNNGYAKSKFMDKAMYDFVTLKMNDHIMDKFRYPITHLYDLGYSMTTKFAMEDFCDYRDDVGVSLSTQVLLSSEWALGIGRTPKINDMEEDITNGLALRERAMLMRESVLHDTDTMRISIYTQTGRPVDATLVVNGVAESTPVSEAVPFTFWDAMQHAQYGNKPYMSVTEPRGWPEAKNDLFRAWKWTPYRERMKEETWNTGLNYCQYGSMTQIFYPSLRTVYRYDTSILSDQWDVDALIYTKHECRKAWARFVGRNDRRAVLQDGIKKYLEDHLSALYSGKYLFDVTVYQTEEEQKRGYIQHVRLRITFPATLRQIIFDVEVYREGYIPEE